MTSVRKVNQMLVGGLSALTSDVIEGQQAVDAENYPIASTEMVQRIQVPVTGVATRAVVSTVLDVTWPYPIVNLVAANQHESNQEFPHFASGVELLTEEHVLLDAQVREWVQDKSDFFTGAKVRLTAWAPDALKATKYRAVMHLSFMGYATAAEDDNETITPPDLGT